MHRAILMSAAPALKGKARKYGGGYRKLALVVVDLDVLAAEGLTAPRMISERARGVVEIVACRSVFWGRGVRSEGVAYRAQLLERAAELNRRFCAPLTLPDAISTGAVDPQVGVVFADELLERGDAHGAAAALAAFAALSKNTRE